MSPTPELPTPIDDPARVEEIADAVRESGQLVLDLEFVSESRYVPELCLVQVAWKGRGEAGDGETLQVLAIDPLAVDPTPVLELVAHPEVETVLHSAQADLALIGYRHGLTARNLYDTQIAAAFLGLGEQIGYAALVETLLGIPVDKGAQFTDWARRPLSDQQLSYALDDVRHLIALWPILRGRLEERGRLDWVRQESDRLARSAAERTPPEEIYHRVKGGHRLRGKAQGALRELAAWRERTALEGNKPPSWILQDRPLLEIARKPPRSLADLGQMRGVRESTVSRWGREILDAARRGAQSPPDREPGPSGRLPEGAQSWSSLLSGIVAARAREVDIAPRFLANRDDLDQLVRWWTLEDRSTEPDLPLLRGWRRDLAGEAVLAWLEGKLAIAVDEGAGIRLVES